MPILAPFVAHALPLLAASAAASPGNGDFDRSFNPSGAWNGDPGWAEFQIDPPGRSAHDTATMLEVLRDGSIVVGGLGGRDPANGNGLLAAARLMPDASPHAFWSSAEDVQGGLLPGRITWPYEFDTVAPFPAGYNPNGVDGIGFGGSGRVVNGTVLNVGKLFAVSPAGTTLNGGLGTCQVIAGGALRDFRALGADSIVYNQAVLSGYVRRYGDQAYLAAACTIERNQQVTVSMPDQLPSSPPGVIGTVGVSAQFLRNGTYDYVQAQRLFRNFNSAADNDVRLCDPGTNATTTPVGSYPNCMNFEFNLGGHLDDLLWSNLSIYNRATGFVQSQVEAAAGGGSDRSVLSVARPPYYTVFGDGTVQSDPSTQRSFPLGDATHPPGSLSFHAPHGVYADGRVWIVMALRPFPGPDVFRDIAVVRLRYDDLSLDTSFGNGTGWRRYSLGGAEVMPNAIAADAQGRILIAGERRHDPNSDDWDFFVMRINDDVIFRDRFE